jgi:transcriptional regulator with XRE-family HTH domain
MFEQQSDAQILAELAERVDYLRRSKGYTDQETAARGGLGVRTLVAFRTSHKDITLSTFVRLLRGLGELNRLEALLPPATPVFSPAEGGYVEPKRRIRKSARRAPVETFEWGDEKPSGSR